MGKLETIIICCIALVSCKSYQSSEIYKDEYYSVLNSTIGNKNEKTVKIYYKAFTSKDYGKLYLQENLDNLIINSVNEKSTQAAYRKIDSIKINENYSEQEKDSLVKLTIRDELLPKVGDFLSPSDIKQMAKMGNRKLVWDKSKLNGNIQTSKDRENIKVSVPVFNESYTIAAYMIEGSSALSLRFCRKNKNKEWEFYCSATIWIE